jgi:GTP cyclohydrolase II
VERARTSALETHVGHLHVVVFTEPGSGCEHMAVVRGDVANAPDVPVCMRARAEAELVRQAAVVQAHGERGEHASWGEDVTRVLGLLEREERGVLVLLDPARSSGGTRPGESLGADERDYVIAADILRDLRVRSVRLMGAARH